MKKVVLSVVLLLAASFAFAQEKAVKEAKKIANGVTPDFAQAEQLINGALTNPETKDQADPEETERKGNGECLPPQAL